MPELDIQPGPWTTASRLHRALACPASAVLKSLRERSEAAIRAAELGRIVHRCKETGEVPPPGHLGHAACTRLAPLRGLWWPPDGLHEVVGIYDHLTRRGRLDGVRGPRGYQGLEAHQLAGTIDYVRPPADRGFGWEMPWVDDLKTGKEAPPPDDEQVLFAALVTADEYGWEGNVLCSITHFPAAQKVEEPDRAEVCVTHDDIEAFRDRLDAGYAMRELQVRRAPVHLQVWPGPHCEWCDARPGCPAWKEEQND